MAWVRSSAAEKQKAREEDAFDEDGDEMGVLQREWRKSMKKRMKEGYLDGIDAGKENSLQTGFNTGYQIGVNLLMPCGKLRGTLSALLTWCQLHMQENTIMEKLGELLTAVCQCEGQIVKGLSSIYKVPHPSDLSDHVEDMDLTKDESSCEQNESRLCRGNRNCCKNQDCNSLLMSRCTTVYQLSDMVNQELTRILKETGLVASQLGISSELLSNLQTLKT
ncbi:hypothetical protein GDO86_011543 [Hymenochirus boettgeri]|uniref:Essential protein Yae1 N-terminal domain-containing protein n=1 Tax=Hymenochirus boettgeri TaxID=247094 RepID=A0A8T2JGQ6_9PIPI|nr:hypothetical protein GDO86_011543 [Hymenochirus boettgeri]